MPQKQRHSNNGTYDNNGQFHPWKPNVDHDNKDSHADGVFGVDHGTVVDKKTFTYQPPTAVAPGGGGTSTRSTTTTTTSYMSFDFASVKLADPATWKPLALPVGGGLLLLLVFIVIIK
jgi:hypothetical protein